jgi:hypothetical protein
MMSKKFVVAIVAMCLWALVVLPATAEMITGSHTTYVKTYQLSLPGFPITTVDPVVSGICFDPSYQDPVTGNYDRLFFLNRGSTTATRNLYWTSPSTQSVSSGVAVTGTTGTSADPTDVVADSSGNVYINFLSTPSIQKVANPTTAPVQTQILGNYGASSTADDDPISIDLIPANFGLTGYGAGDLLLFDNGLDADSNDTLSAVKNNPPTAAWQVLWSNTVTPDHAYRGAASPVEGKFYFADNNTNGMKTVDIGGTVYPAILRVGGNMTLETVALNLPVGETFTQLDDAVAVNPVDGSVWLVRNVGGERSVVRVDTATAVSQGGNVYLAPSSVEITWDNEAFDCGINSMCFSPDGKYLAIGSLVGANSTGNRTYDNMSIFAVPEPSACLLLGLGLLSMATIRRRC